MFIVVANVLFCIAGGSACPLYQLNPSTGAYVRIAEIEAYSTPLSAAAYYGFDGANPNLPTGFPNLQPDRTHLFLVNSAVDGLTLCFIHDERNDPTPGRAETQWTVLNDPDGAQWLAQDGPPGFDTYTGSPGDSVFTALHNWPGQNSDGAVIGSLDGAWVIESSFTDVSGIPGDEIVGLADWIVYSGDGTTHSLALQSDRPVRIASSELVLDANPEMVAPADTLTLATSGGVPGLLNATVVVDVSGTGLFYVIDLGPYDPQCQRNLTFTVPPGLSGLDVTFLSFGAAKNGKKAASNPEVVTFL